VPAVVAVYKEAITVCIGNDALDTDGLRRPSGIAVQFMHMDALCRRELLAWTYSAANSLPVPVSHGAVR
jgi:hypothetical protein